MKALAAGRLAFSLSILVVAPGIASCTGLLGDFQPGDDGGADGGTLAEAATGGEGGGSGEGGTGCVGGGACVPNNPCHAGKVDCSTGTATCKDTGGIGQNGTPCGNGQVCSMGVCAACTSGSPCTPADACHLGALDCSGAQPVCTDTGMPAPSGAQCGTGMVCNSGVCTACAAGATCTPTNACHVGAIGCSTGMPACMDTGSNARNGSPCETNQVCLNGACGPCMQGASCPPMDPCHTGTLDCSTGTPTCMDTGSNAGDGMSCGTNMVCNKGACSPCTQGAACTPGNVCDNGSTDCSTGVPVCKDTGANAGANGMMCAAGKSCFNGACAGPPSISISPTPWNYGSIAPGQSSADQAFTVTNGGQAPSGALSVSVTGSTPAQFIVASDGCSNSTLSGGGTCTIKVHFSPNLAGPYSATLAVSANPGGSAQASLAGTSGAACGELVADANTIALWHFNDGSGLTTADASGNAHTGQLGNSTTANSQDPSWATGRFGGGLFFASANQQYVQGAGSNTFPSNQVTVEFWEKAVSPFGSGSGGYSQPFTAGFIDVAVNISPSDMEFGVGDGNNWSYPSAMTTGLTDGNWHHVAYTYDGVNQIFYVDGAMVGATSPMTAPVLTSTGGYGYQIGGRPQNTFFNGTIDEMRLSSVARTSDQMKNYYASASTCP